MTKVAIIGLGRFGLATAKEIMDSGGEVLAIDADPRIIARHDGEFSVLVRLDARDCEALRAQGLEHMDAVVMAIGEDVEASVLATDHLKQLGCRRVIARAKTGTLGHILTRVGADQVVYPEDRTARQIAQEILHPRLAGYVDVGGGFALSRVEVAETTMVGRPLVDVVRETRLNLAAVLVQRARSGGRVDTLLPDEETRLEMGDRLLLLGRPADLEKWPE
jgi:trk system potassium uptake protein TrkA